MSNFFLLNYNPIKYPEIKSAITQGTGQSLKIANLSIAVNERKNKDGTMKVQYFNLTAFDKTADIIESYVKKGHKICVTGSLQNRSWDKPDGTKAYATDILIQELEMLTTKMDADRLMAEGLANPTPNSESYAPQSQPTTAKADPAPVVEEKLPVINVDELNVQMPF